MEGGVFEAIAAWSAEGISGAQLQAILERSRSSLSSHRQDLSAVVEGLSTAQQERCQELIDYALELLDLMQWELQEALQALAASDRARLFQAGDCMARARFQLNQTLVEFSHQALLALGPTSIPSLNHLLALRQALRRQPDEANARELQEAVQAERLIASRMLAELGQAPEVAEAVTLANALRQLDGALARVAGLLSEPPFEAAAIGAAFEGVEKGFREVASLGPVVRMRLSSQGVTELPDLNVLLELLDQMEAGQLGDMPLMEALEAVEVCFSATESKCQLTADAETSVLIAQELRSTLESFQVFREGLDSVYRFLEERDLAWLQQGRSQLLEFGARFLAHKQRLDQLREQQGKVLCPFCSQFNQSLAQRCQRCAKPLPLNLGMPERSTTFEVLDYRPSQEAETLLVTANLAPVYQAIRELSEGRMETDVFLGVLERLEMAMEGGLERVSTESVAAPDRSGLYAKLDQGVDEMAAGIELLRDYSASRDQAILVAAVHKLDSGAKKVAEAEAKARQLKG